MVRYFCYLMSTINTAATWSLFHLKIVFVIFPLEVYNYLVSFGHYFYKSNLKSYCVQKVWVCMFEYQL